MRRISRWQYQYLGTKRFPDRISELERLAFFTFTEAELADLKSRFTANLRLAAALQLGFVKMTGCTLDRIRMLPRDLLKHVGAQLEVEAPAIAALRTIYRRRTTLYEHQAWAMARAGFKRPNDRQLARLAAHLMRESRYKADVDLLVESGKVWLYQHDLLNQSDRRIRDLARKAAAQSEEGLFSLIKAAVPETTLKMWEKRILQPREDLGITWLEWLALPPRKGNVTALRERIDRIAFLKELKVDQVELKGVAMEKIRLYASELKRIRPARFQELKDPTRTLRLVCFLRHALTDTTDTAVAIAGRNVRKLWREAWEKAEHLDAEGMISARSLLNEARAILNNPDVDDGSCRQLLKQLLNVEDQKFPSRSAAARWVLTEPGSPIRSLLAEVQKLDLSCSMDSPVAHSLQLVKGLYGRRETALPEGGYYKVSKAWKSLVDGPDRERAMRALEADTIFGLRKGLRSGSVYIDSSGAFRNREELLISKNNWAKDRRRHYANMSIPEQPLDYLDELVRALKKKLAAVADAVRKGDLQIKDGAIRFHKVKADLPPKEWVKASDQLDRKIPKAQLPDVMLEVDSLAGVTRALLGRPAKSEQELLKVYAGMLAHGTSMDATTLSLMIPQVDPSVVLSGMQIFEDTAAVRAANDAVTSYQRQFAVASAWGDGSIASSDMMSLDVSQRIWGARLDPKRRLPSVGTYTHVSDQWTIIYDQPIMLNERQAGAAIEGVVRQREIEIDQLAVDTHGYTDFAMGQAKLLRFDLCPRLKNLKDRKLHAPSNIYVPEVLEAVSTNNIHMSLIRRHWDDLVRIAASIESGQVSATIAIARFGSAAAGDPVYRAGVSLGRLVRSLFLCDYLLNEDFRRAINRILAHGESIHNLQRAICLGSFSKPRGQKEEDLIALSGSLTLLTNMCLAWTTSRIQAALSEQGTKPPEWLKTVSPVKYAHINFRGTFRFPVSEYADRLLVGEPHRAAAR